jgi:hypothetical protein
MGGWGESRGPSAELVARRERIRAADAMERAIAEWIENPCDTNDQMMRVRAAEYRQARSIDNGMEGV